MAALGKADHFALQIRSLCNVGQNLPRGSKLLLSALLLAGKPLG